MKFAIIISGNIAKAPYISYYINLFKAYQVDYDVISWNRLGLDGESALSFNVRASEGKGYLKRLIQYVHYRRHIIKILETNRYDKIVIATAAIGVLMLSYLKKHYTQRFIFDIRDYSITCKLFSRSFNSIVHESKATIISSVGFKYWLPKQGNYFISHNFPFQHTDHKIEKTAQILHNVDTITLTITTIGTLRDFVANKYIIDALSNDDKFNLKYIGAGPAYEPLLNYVKMKSITNTSFYGYYKKEDEVHLLKNTHLINNYTNDDLNSRTLTTNRFYLSVVLGIPMIVRHGTHQAKLCQDFKLGCIINPSFEIKNQLLSYINSFDKEVYNKGRTDFLRVVEEDTKKLEAFLIEFIKPVDTPFI